MLDEGVVAEVQDIDLCLLLGPAGRSTWRASRRTWTGPVRPSRAPGALPPARCRVVP